MQTHAIRDPLQSSHAYGFLARAFTAPDPDLAGELADAWCELETVFGDEAGRAAWSGLGSALADLDPDVLEREYFRCFGYAISKDCPPYETEYGQSHVFQKTNELADIAGFYRAFGLEPAADLHDRPDALRVELEFMEFLCFKEAYGIAQGHAAARVEVGREAQAKFLREHLGRWVFCFTQRLAVKAAGCLYEHLARLLEAHLGAELAALGLTPAEVTGPNMLSDAVDVGNCGGCRPDGAGIAAECGG